MADSSAIAQTNNSACWQKGLLDIEKLFAEIQNENDAINIKEEVLVLQNGTTLNVSSQNSNNIENSLTSNLYIETNLKCGVTIGREIGTVIKKEKVSPAVAEERLDSKNKETIIPPRQDMAYGIITPDLKKELRFVSGVKENLNGECENDKVVSDAAEKRGLTIKKEITDSNDGFVTVETEAANGSKNINFIKEEVEDEAEEISDYGKSSCPENTRVAYDMDEQYDSFNEEMSISEEEVNSSDIEEMFNNERTKDAVEKNENDQPLECLTCGKSFKLDHNFQKHLQKHLNAGSEVVHKFECEICSKRFKKKHHLQRHILSHTQKKDFACAHCDKSYIAKYDLQKHLSSCHTIRECSICGMKFQNYAELKKHHVIHKKSDRKPLAVSCHICQKTFLKEKYLKRHLKVHAKMTRFACEICNKSFLYPFLLQEHSRTHTGEKPFQCDKCDRKFSTKSNQVRHSRTHFKMRSCKNCSAEFEDEEQFNAHKESCVLSYECGKCGWISERLSNLRRHVKTHTKHSNPDTDSSINSNMESENIFVRIV